jgi:hypothetical protein
MNVSKLLAPFMYASIWKRNTRYAFMIFFYRGRETHLNAFMIFFYKQREIHLHAFMFFSTHAVMLLQPAIYLLFFTRNRRARLCIKFEENIIEWLQYHKSLSAYNTLLRHRW